MFDAAYEAYKQKCKELRIKPSSKKDMFGEQIEAAKHDKRQSISELSRARKEKGPALSETAKKVISTKKVKVPVKTETKGMM